MDVWIEHRNMQEHSDEQYEDLLFNLEGIGHCLNRT